MIRFALVAIATALVSGCATQRIPYGKEHVARGFEDRREYLLGKWTGEAPLVGGGQRTWLVERFANGTFQTTFRANSGDASGVSEMHEYGDWGLSGDVYFTRTRGHGVPTDRWTHDEPRSSYNDDAYLITTLTPQEFRYTSVATRRSYRTRKVAADFTLPPVVHQGPVQPGGVSQEEFRPGSSEDFLPDIAAGSAGLMNIDPSRVPADIRPMLQECIDDVAAVERGGKPVHATPGVSSKNSDGTIKTEPDGSAFVAVLAMDGGTRMYQGRGYVIIANHRLASIGGIRGLLVGPEVIFEPPLSPPGERREVAISLVRFVAGIEAPP